MHKFLHATGIMMIHAFVIVQSIKKQPGLVSFFKSTPATKWSEGVV